MIKEYEEHVAKQTNRLEARIAAAQVKMLVDHAKYIEILVRNREKDFRMTWRTMTTGLILGFFEKQAIRFDNTYRYLNNLSSNIIDFFELLRIEYGYEKENPAIEAQKILFTETKWLRWQASERYKLFDETLRKNGNVTASSLGRKPARSD